MTALLEIAPCTPPSNRSIPFLERGRVKAFPPRSILIHEGEDSDLVYLIESGRGKIYSNSATGKEIVLGTFGPGDMLGAPSLDGGVSSASVMTLEPTRCHVLPVVDLRASIARHPPLAMEVIAGLIGLLRTSNERVKSLALEDVLGRVVRFLLTEAVDEGGQRVVLQRPTQQAIADRVGCSREMVSRILTKLESSGCITIRRDRIVIEKDPPTDG